MIKSFYDKVKLIFRGRDMTNACLWFHNENKKLRRHIAKLECDLIVAETKIIELKSENEKLKYDQNIPR